MHIIKANIDNDQQILNPYRFTENVDFLKYVGSYAVGLALLLLVGLQFALGMIGFKKI